MCELKSNVIQHPRRWKSPGTGMKPLNFTRYQILKPAQDTKRKNGSGKRP
jgi:hypothetical protein